MALLLAAAALASTWLDVPFVRQDANGCGAACILMVLRYWNPADVVDLRELERTLAGPGSPGISAEAMERHFRARGFRTFAFRGSWDDLRHHIARGRPLIVSLRDRGARMPHFVVVAGVDSDPGIVLVNDPAGQKLTRLGRSEFEARWKRLDCWTLLALPGAK